MASCRKLSVPVYRLHMKTPDLLHGINVNLKAPGKIEFEPFSIESTVEPWEVIAKTVYTAISPGTEVAAYAGEPPLRPGPAYPRLLGYSNVARVLKVGRRVKAVRVGHLVFTNESHRSLFKIPVAKVLATLPKNLDPKYATFAELYAFGRRAIANAAPLPGSAIAVIGLGTLGLGAIEQSASSGFLPIAFSNSERNARTGRALGAVCCFGRNDKRVTEKLAKAVPRGIGTVILTTNSWADWDLALRIISKNGTICVLGFPGRSEGAPTFNPLHPHLFYVKKLKIVSVDVGNSPLPSKKFDVNHRAILALMAKGKLRPSKLTSGTYGFREIETAYRQLLSKKRTAITYVLRW
jgi:threonine dehydrogenase-like Zn-dependent dehydrogenase